MANWLITVNCEVFALDKAFDVLDQIYWKNDFKTEGKGLQEGDVVYAYVTKPESKVMYQFKVIGRADHTQYPSAQREFWNDPTEFSTVQSYAIFEKIKKVDKTSLSFDTLVQQGLIPNAPIQGRRTDRDKNTQDPIYIFLAYIAHQFANDFSSIDYPDEADIQSKTFPEGAKKTVQVNQYERNSEARAKCIEIHGVRCSICNMSFAETYGHFAKDFIHVHHIKPLHEISESYQVNPETDLIPVCSNCHAMLHRQENGIPMTIERLKLLFELSNAK